MKEIRSSSGELLLSLSAADAVELCSPQQHPVYTVFLVPEGAGTFHADFGAFDFRGPVLLFATPLQVIYLQQ